MTVRDRRIFSVTCRGNGEFSTARFKMPAAGLALNANAHYQPVEGDSGRAYIMAELRDEQGMSFPGYERSKCLITNQAGLALPLIWDEATGSELAGRVVFVRFYVRDAKLSSLQARQ